jgi:hypothetical protein
MLTNVASTWTGGHQEDAREQPLCPLLVGYAREVHRSSCKVRHPIVVRHPGISDDIESSGMETWSSKRPRPPCHGQHQLQVVNLFADRSSSSPAVGPVSAQATIRQLGLPSEFVDLIPLRSPSR